MIEIKNKSAYFNYFVEKEIECGIVLNGSEIKSIRNGSCNIKDSYVRIKDNECYIINMFIAKYNEASIFNHDEYHERKLLLHKREILKLKNKLELEGYTLIPLRFYFVKNKCKVEIGVCKGKKNYDKKESIKERDIQRELEKDFKYR